MRTTYPFPWRLIVGLALLVAQSPVRAGTDTPERIEWNKTPIRLELAVGREQRVAFPAAVTVGVPVSVQPLLRTQSVNGTVYLLAHAPFGAQRLMVREPDSGRIYLFDVTASDNGDGGAGHPLEVYVTGDHERDKDRVTVDGDPVLPRSGYVELTRFAARQLYAPARLVQGRPGIVRVPVRREAIDLLRGGAIEARPLVGWRARGLYVTAVKLTNRSNQARTLDPRELRGSWLTASFQHHRLWPAGDEADTTAVYLISARPFEVSF